ncbi:hypothetical protein ABK040_016300 [Willaertia magna]
MINTNNSDDMEEVTTTNEQQLLSSDINSQQQQSSTITSTQQSSLNHLKKQFTESDEENKLRFEMELEFIELLAHPTYLQYLAQYKYFEDEGFIEYLKYLQYWKSPEYSKFIKFPYCLYFLDRLINDLHFREECKSNAFRDIIHQQTMSHWKYYRRNREEKVKEQLNQWE